MKLIQSMLISILFVMISAFGISKETRIEVLDNINNEPVAFANMIIYPLSDNLKSTGYITDENGIVNADISEESVLKITYIGYKDYTDTISPGEHKTLYLKSISYNVDEVVVTGQYGESTQDRSIYKVSVINSKEIDQRAAVNVKEMLSTELNIRTTFDGALGSSMTMRGLGGEHIKLLIDGVPVIGRENGNIDLDQINLQNVDHVEVINGPMSVVYGSNALAGVVNIIMKPPDKYLFSSQVEAYYESVGVYNINTSVSGTYKRNSLSFTGARNFFDGYDPPGYSEYRIVDLSDNGTRWKPKEQWNFTGDYKYKWDKAYLKLGASYFNQELRDLGKLELPYYETRLDKFYYTTRLVYRSDFRYDFSKKSRINATASYSRYKKIKNTTKIDLATLERYPTPGMQDTTKFDNVMFRSDYSYGDENSIFKYQVGVDLNNETGTGKRLEDNSQEIGDYAFFASLNYTPWSVLNIQPGIRVIYNTRFNAPVIYSINAKYDVTERFSVRASVASGFRAPSLKELYLNFVDVNHNIHGNPDLKAETSFNTNLILQYNSTAERDYVWGLELNLFNNNINDNIQLLEIGTNTMYYSYVNVNRFISRGAELNFNNNVYPWLTVKFGVTLTGQNAEYSEDKSSGFEYYTDFNTSLNYWVKKYDLNFSVYYKYNGRSPRLNQAEISEELELRFMDPYHTLDANASIWLWKRRINLQAGAKNLFDNTEIGISGDSQGGSHANNDGSTAAVNWGRTFFVKLQFRFNK